MSKYGEVSKSLLDSRQDLENDLKRNLAYFNNDKNWGGSEEAQEKETIQNHIKWIKKQLRLYDKIGL